MNELPHTITIDGPVAAGKTTIGQSVAKTLGYLFIDTGFFYRAVTYLALKDNIDPKDNEKTSQIAQTVELKIEFDGEKTIIYANGSDITPFLRTPEVDEYVPFSSANPQVRAALTPRMRKIAQDHPVVMVGRDIGTVVLPNADVKLWINASDEIRARRRTLEMEKRGKNTTYEQVLDGMKKRDALDASRQTAPMKIPENAIIIDNNNRPIAEVVNEVLSKIKSSP